MRRLLQWSALVALMIVATILLGWWTVPILGGVWGAAMAASRRVALTAAAAGATSWAILLVWTAFQGPVGSLAVKVGAIFGLPGLAFLTLPVLFAALLAGAAAGTSAALLQFRSFPEPETQAGPGA